MLRGYRCYHVSPDVRRPFTFGLLNDLVSACRQVCLSSFKVQLFRTAFLLAFFGAFRISELVAFNRHSHSSLLLSDVSLYSNCLYITFRRSNIDPYSKECWIIINQLSDISFCRVCRFFLIWLLTACWCFFLVHEDSTPLTKFQFNAVLKKCFLYLGSFKFRAHSFRIGAATEAAALDLGDDVVRNIRRWDSDRSKLT